LGEKLTPKAGQSQARAGAPNYSCEPQPQSENISFGGWYSIRN
jgi:hypothetical protein